MAKGIESTGVGDGLLSIASGLLGVALIALILNKADNASKLITSSSTAYGSLLKSVMTGGN
jgi:hypothetical protein